MSRAEDFIATTDFATLKNDGFASTTVTLTPQILSANQTFTVTQDIDVGQVNASSRIRMASAVDGGSFYAGFVLVLTRQGTITTPGDATYSTYAYVSRVGATTLRLSLSAQNPYSVAMATILVNEVVTFEINTFLSPFV